MADKKVVLTDDQDGKDQFSVLWQGFNMGQSGLVGLEKLAMGFKLLEKFKEISLEGGEDGMRELIPGEHVFILEVMELDHLKETILETSWKPFIAGKVLDTLKLLNNAEEYVPPATDIEQTGVSRSKRVG